ncbi:MAG: hypothetical protein IH628_12150 [Proteobacteria bacterium]|nr:hypothetical protein [Pseudomonadota bacterium]
MTTKPPSPVAEFPENSLEKIAYQSVQEIPTQEPNDRHRLGYHVWAWLKERKGTLNDAVRISGSRILMPEEEAVKTIRTFLNAKGIQTL